MWDFIPLVPLDPSLALNPAEAFDRLRSNRLPFFLDGSTGYSFVGVEPEERWTFREGSGGDPFAHLETFAARPGVSVGYLAYDLGRWVERLAKPVGVADPLPLAAWARYPFVLAFDNARGRWFASPGQRPGWLDRLRDEAPPASFRVGAWTSDWSREEYLRAARRVKAWIREGEIYQANLSQRFTAPFAGDPWGWYRTLRLAHPAPYGAYLADPEEGWAVLSLSPECFLAWEGETVRTFPIKGTRPRGSAPEEDEVLRAALVASEKDRAELAMIVDLERNDLGRVSASGAVRVEVPRRIASFAAVHHAEAVVAGRLRPGVGCATLLRATFPSGSVTGCPKIRAMEILTRLEGRPRGVYTGAVGLLAPGGGRLNVAIRTISVSLATGCASLRLGGGIVADSDPASEYEETLHKGKPFLEAASTF